MKKDVKQLIKYAEDFGFHWEGYTGTGHIRLRHKHGKTVTMASSPNGGNRWRKNALAIIHRIDADSKDKK